MESSLLLLFTCILCTLVPTGFALTCNVCNGEDWKSCKGTPKQCPSDSDACMATHESYSIGGKELTMYRKACGSRMLCSQKESSTFSAVAVKISSSCCFISNCDPPMPVLPKTKTEKNGVSCMECQGSADKPCTSSTYRDCTGDEKTCVSLMVKTNSPASMLSLSGCGTPGLCNITKLDIKIGDVDQQMEFGCPSGSGSGSLQRSLSLLIFASMFLFKVLE